MWLVIWQMEAKVSKSICKTVEDPLNRIRFVSFMCCCAAQSLVKEEIKIEYEWQHVQSGWYGLCLSLVNWHQLSRVSHFGAQQLA